MLSLVAPAKRGQVQDRPAGSSCFHVFMFHVFHFGGCSLKFFLASSSPSTSYALVSTGLSSIQLFSPAQLPSGFCREAILSISSMRQSCLTPWASVMIGSS